MTDDPNLDDLAESVASRERVDWDSVAAHATDADSRAEVLALRDVARLAEFHHSLQTEAAPAAAPLSRWGDLMLLEHVASGGASEVYRAWDATLQREVALKLLDVAAEGASAESAWLEEARTLAKIRDPHVVSVLGAARHEGRAGLWMEFLHGPTLEQDIARRGPLPAAEVARIGAQMARALAAAHAASVVHRDVKPANIVLEPHGRAVLTDFGLGQRRSGGGGARPYSGSPLFMSPQRLGGAAARPTDDLYALGVTLAWALTGSPPFGGGSIGQLREQAARGPEPPLHERRPDAPQALVSAIERAMSADPERRPGSARELAAALESRDAVSAAGTAANRRHAGAFGMAMLVVLAAWLWFAIARAPHRAPAVTTPPANPSGVYDVSAAFVRRSAGGDHHLDSGDRVTPGDRVSLEFRSTRPVWVYVIDADERGESYLLFPQPLFDRQNPLPADSTLTLPGTRGGRENAWTVTSRGGREHLLVVANPAPVPELETELSRLQAPVPNATVRDVRLGAGTMERLRGMGGVSEVPQRAARSDPSPLLEHIQSLAGRERGVRGTWVRQVVLENPLR